MNLPKHKKWIAPTVMAMAAASAVAYYVYQSRQIEVTEYVYGNPKIPEAFEGFRMAVVTGLRVRRFGKEQEKLIDLLKKNEPNLIAIIGDLHGYRDRQNPPLMAFIGQAIKIAPTYMVPGHRDDQGSRGGAPLQKALSEVGAVVLDNQKETLYRDGAVLELIGLRDCGCAVRAAGITRRALQVHDALKTIAAGPTGNLRILLSGRPGPAEVCLANGVDLALSGSADRILRAKQQGDLERAAGRHQTGALTLIISRGAGNHFFPVRINHRPELVMVTLTGKDKKSR